MDVKLQTLVVDDFLCFGPNAVLDFRTLENERVLVAGANEDSTGADSNGAGKTALFDAIAWCLFGSTSRGLRADELIRRGANTASVTLTLKVGGIDVYIRRERGSSNTLELRVGTQKYVGVGAGTIVQREIEKLLNFDFPTFLNVGYLAADQVGSLVNESTTPAERMKMISLMLGFEVLDAYKDRVSSNLTSVVTTVSSKESQLRALPEVDVNQLDSQLKHLELQRDEHYEELEALRQRLQLARESEAVSRDYQDKLSSLKLIQDTCIRLQEELDSVTTVLTEDNSELCAQLQYASATINSQKELLNEKRKQLAMFEVEFRNADIEYNKQALLIGQLRCPTCGSMLDEKFSTSLGSWVDELAGKRRYFTESIVSTCKVIEEGETKLHSLYNEESALKLKQESVDRRKDSKDILEKNLSESLGRKKSIEEAVNALSKRAREHEDTQELSRRIRPLETDSRLLEQVIGEMKVRIHEGRRALVTKAALREELEALRKDVIEWNLLDKAFGPYGVRANILTTFLPELEEEANIILRGGLKVPIEIGLDTIKDLKSGGQKDTFEIFVTDTTSGNKAPWRAWSRGERQRIALSLLVALRQLVCRAKGVSIDIFLLDEIVDALDETGVGTFFSLLDSVPGTKLVVSHDSRLASRFKKVVYVEKRNEMSSIEVS